MALQYETTKEHTITVTGYEGTVRHLVIPDQVDGCPTMVFPLPIPPVKPIEKSL